MIILIIYGSLAILTPEEHEFSPCGYFIRFRCSTINIPFIKKTKE